uniref:E3 ubiquitin-protein ligase ZNRF1 n=1 Tax=Angiostrongylus cantonensis TaxID=6313 RepID=A0A0K0DLD4_ANGCA
MGGRQSSVAEDRPRSNSVDATNASRGQDDQSRNPSRSVMTAAEFLQTIRNTRIVGSSSDSNGSEDDAGPSTLHHFSHARTGRLRGNFSRRSMPVFMMDMTCPICHKTVPSDEADVHLVMCLTRPKITYNDDVLTEDKGECSICLEEMLTGAIIARLPCLCIYHKQCIDDWFKRKNCCPEHPGDD